MKGDLSVLTQYYNCVKGFKDKKGDWYLLKETWHYVIIVDDVLYFDMEEYKKTEPGVTPEQYGMALGELANSLDNIGAEMAKGFKITYKSAQPAQDEVKLCEFKHNSDSWSGDFIVYIDENGDISTKPINEVEKTLGLAQEDNWNLNNIFESYWEGDVRSNEVEVFSKTQVATLKEKILEDIGEFNFARGTSEQYNIYYATNRETERIIKIINKRFGFN